MKLFHRIDRHIEITEAGNLLQVEAQKILDSVALTEWGLRELNNLQRGEYNTTFACGGCIRAHLKTATTEKALMQTLK